MIQWESPSIVLGYSLLGENDLLAYIFTQNSGLEKGLVKGGSSRRKIAFWGMGNIIVATWKARLETQLGYLSAEMIQSLSVNIFDSPVKLLILESVTTMMIKTLDTKVPLPELFDETIYLLKTLSTETLASSMRAYIKWEVSLLYNLGYSLDLSQCAVTGERENLSYVSPVTGRAVTEKGAGIWKNKLLILPSFLKDKHDKGNSLQWINGLNLTGFFLQKYALGLFHRTFPLARERLLQYLLKRQ